MTVVTCTNAFDGNKMLQSNSCLLYSQNVHIGGNVGVQRQHWMRLYGVLLYIIIVRIRCIKVSQVNFCQVFILCKRMEHVKNRCLTSNKIFFFLIFYSRLIGERKEIEYTIDVWHLLLRMENILRPSGSYRYTF